MHSHGMANCEASLTVCAHEGQSALGDLCHFQNTRPKPKWSHPVSNLDFRVHECVPLAFTCLENGSTTPYGLVTGVPQLSRPLRRSGIRNSHMALVVGGSCYLSRKRS